MAYNEFTLATLKQDLGIKIEENTSIVLQPPPVPPSDDFLLRTLQLTLPLALAIDTEKARAEMIIFPVLLEVKKLAGNRISLFSGKEFNVAPEKKLTGKPDFLISISEEQYYIDAPVMSLVEAKNNQLNSGLGQCGAEMVAAQIFNLNSSQQLSTIYGCVTNGTLWKFLKLVDNILYIDPLEIPLEPIERIIGIFLDMINSK